MNLDEIKELIVLMRKNKIAEIDLEQEGSKVRIVAAQPESHPAPGAPVYIGAAPYPPPQPPYPPAPVGFAPSGAPPAGREPAAGTASQEAFAPPEEAAQPLPASVVEIKAPMVGTFYRAPAPDARAYVEVGSVIHKDTILCIVEAMKLMNEIQADMHGRILKILVDNGQPVEFNQPLFLVEKL